jgi:hypothetical protein
MFSLQYLSMGGIKLMKRSLFAASLLSLALVGIGNAQGTVSSPETDAHYTQAQLKQLALNAHTPTQYSNLASYFSGQPRTYLQKAADEKREWERRSQNITSIAAKYPRPVDSARNLYEYYMYKASEAGSLEAKYSHLATQDAPVNAQ